MNAIVVGGRAGVAGSSTRRRHGCECSEFRAVPKVSDARAPAHSRLRPGLTSHLTPCLHAADRKHRSLDRNFRSRGGRITPTDARSSTIAPLAPSWRERSPARLLRGGTRSSRSRRVDPESMEEARRTSRSIAQLRDAHGWEEATHGPSKHRSPLTATWRSSSRLFAGGGASAARRSTAPSERRIDGASAAPSRPPREPVDHRLVAHPEQRSRASRSGRRWPRSTWPRIRT